mgnify:CR=1 FL=1
MGGHRLRNHRRGSKSHGGGGKGAATWGAMRAPPAPLLPAAAAHVCDTIACLPACCASCRPGLGLDGSHGWSGHLRSAAGECRGQRHILGGAKKGGCAAECSACVWRKRRAGSQEARRHAAGPIGSPQKRLHGPALWVLRQALCPNPRLPFYVLYICLATGDLSTQIPCPSPAPRVPLTCTPAAGLQHPSRRSPDVPRPAAPGGGGAGQPVHPA